MHPVFKLVLFFILDDREFCCFTFLDRLRFKDNRVLMIPQISNSFCNP